MKGEKRKGRRLLRRIVPGLAVAGMLTAGVAALLVYHRRISFPDPSAKRYPIQGVDVSHYQGEIDWEILSCQDITFAFIKATEGSSGVDDKFRYNWEEAGKTALKVGAYHFFSFDSPGETQADNFIDVVGKRDGMLLPVVDVEFYGDKWRNPPDTEVVREQLQAFLNCLEEYYGVKPIIYTTQKAYYRYIRGAFTEYPLWIRNTYFSPDLTMYGKWTFWQYTDKAILDGYQGTEKYIDKNVFRGTEEEFEAYLWY